MFARLRCVLPMYRISNAGSIVVIVHDDCSGRQSASQERGGSMRSLEPLTIELLHCQRSILRLEACKCCEAAHAAKRSESASAGAAGCG